MELDAVKTEEELRQFREKLAKLSPAPEVLQQLIAIRESSPERYVVAVEDAIEEYVTRYTSLLTPHFHVVPWSDRIVERERFLEVYQRTRSLAGDFSTLTAPELASVLTDYPAALMVFRLITGYTWTELAEIVRSQRDQQVSSRKLQQIERAETLDEIPGDEARNERLLAEIAGAVYGLVSGDIMGLPEDVESGHFRTRQYKVDTTEGWITVENAASGGVGYADVLYERYTGRPFAYMRDAWSEEKGAILEDAVAALLDEEGIPYERITDNTVEGWPQAPDFFLPDRQNPEVAIEAKLVADGGTARDKASRIERLARMCDRQEVLLVAVIDGTGFRRVGDTTLPIVKSTRGHTYTLQNLESLCEIPRVQRLRQEPG
ncbi:MAG: hypothetical protein R6X33_15705 [Candidatus Brocadiia bacterium]